MPAFICETRAGLGAPLKAQLARKITDIVNDVIKSELDLISVVLHELAEGSTFRAGEPTREAIIFGHIRKGRSKEAIDRLGLSLSRTWSDLTGMSEDEVEIAIARVTPAEHTFRYGARLPEPPFA